MAFRRTKHAVYNTKYRQAWCPKYRQDLLATAVLIRGGRKDPEKYQRPRAVPAIPDVHKKALERRAVGG